MMKRIFFALELFLVLTLVACGGTPQSSRYSGDFGIIGGAEVADTDPIAKGTVALYDQLTQRFICSASLLSNTVVLTAAHCVHGFSNTHLYVVFGTRLVTSDSGEAPNYQTRKVTAFRENPKYGAHSDDEKDHGDIAVLKFEDTAPEGFAAVPVLSNPAALADGSRITLAGYGYSDNADHTGSGILRKVDVKVKQAQYGLTEFLVDQTAGQGACHGDSGGPAFVFADGKLFLFGVASRGENDPNDTCATYGAYTNILAYTDWIASAIEDMHK